MARINDLTGETNTKLNALVRKAYRARYGENTAAKISYSSPSEDRKVRGRIHFSVKVGNQSAFATYKPKRGSVWVEWD